MHTDKLGDAIVSRIQKYSDSPKGETAITGQRVAASSVEHNMCNAAVRR